MTRASVAKACAAPVLASAAYPSTGGTITLKRFDSTAGLSYPSGSPSVQITDELFGTQTLKFTTAVSTSAECQITLPRDLTTPRSGNFIVSIYVPDATKVQEIRVFAGLNGYTKWWQNQHTVNASGSLLRDKSGWHNIELGRLIGAASNAFSWTSDPVQAFKVRVIPVTGESATVYLHSITLRPRRRPMWVIGFDDNRKSVVNPSASITLRGVAGTYSGKQILDAYGFKGTLYIVGSLVDDGSNMSSADIVSLAAAGWDVQAQCYYNPVGDGQHGSRLLGPFGHASRAVASVDTAANTIAASAAHLMPTAGTYEYPIKFRGTSLPNPLQADVLYYARQTSATAFSVHPTAAQSMAGTGAIDLTTTGTPANFSFYYGLSTNDETAILADYQAVNALIRGMGLLRPRHVAYNQGGVDTWVQAAAIRAGYETGRSTENATPTAFVPDPAEWSVQQFVPLNNIYQIEGGIPAATIQGYVDAVIARGGIGGSYTHYVDTTNGQDLANLCDYLWRKQNAGEIDVVTVSQFQRLAGTGRAFA
jgi:hypothetical protein